MNKLIKILISAVVVIFINVTFAGSENSLATSSKRVYLNSSQQGMGWSNNIAGSSGGSSYFGKFAASADTIDTMMYLTSDNIVINEENPARVSAKVTGCSVSTSDPNVKTSASRNDNGCEIVLDYSTVQIPTVGNSAEVNISFEKDKSSSNEFYSDMENIMLVYMGIQSILAVLMLWALLERSKRFKRLKKSFKKT